MDPTHSAAKHFMSNLEKSLAVLPPKDRKPIALVDGPVPGPIVRASNLVRRQSELLTLMGESVRASPEGRYRIASDGNIVRVTPNGVAR